jgi:hypothetical protein
VRSFQLQGLLGTLEHACHRRGKTAEDLDRLLREMGAHFDRFGPFFRVHDRRIGRVVDVRDERVDALSRLLALVCQLANFRGHDGEPLAMLSGACRFDRSIQGQEIGLIG